MKQDDMFREKYGIKENEFTPSEKVLLWLIAAVSLGGVVYAVIMWGGV